MALSPPTSAADAPSGSDSTTSKPPFVASPQPGGDTHERRRRADLVGTGGGGRYPATVPSHVATPEHDAGRGRHPPGSPRQRCRRATPGRSSVRRHPRTRQDRLRARDGHLTPAVDPDLAVETARLHLDAVQEPALDLHRLLWAAHNETAHITATERLDECINQEAPAITPRLRRTEDRQPPKAAGGTGPDISR
jgi:hypothetical protein